MSHTFQLSDEQFASLAAFAAKHKQTPEMLFQAWLSELIHSEMGVTPTQTEQVRSEEDILDSSLFQIAGIFAIGEPGWADRAIY